MLSLTDEETESCKNKKILPYLQKAFHDVDDSDDDSDDDSNDDSDGDRF